MFLPPGAFPPSKASDPSLYLKAPVSGAPDQPDQVPGTLLYIHNPLIWSQKQLFGRKPDALMSLSHQAFNSASYQCAFLRFATLSESVILQRFPASEKAYCPITCTPSGTVKLLCTFPCGSKTGSLLSLLKRTPSSDIYFWLPSAAPIDCRLLQFIKTRGEILFSEPGKMTDSIAIFWNTYPGSFSSPSLGVTLFRLLQLSNAACPALFNARGKVASVTIRLILLPLSQAEHPLRPALQLQPLSPVPLLSHLYTCFLSILLQAIIAILLLCSWSFLSPCVFTPPPILRILLIRTPS